MARRMLIEATHPEETRVVILNGTRLEEFDFETSTKKQIKGNIYLAKVTRVEPSLQAAFVEYGGNRHGFLAFSEIHPDYYRIPVSDRRPQPSEERRPRRAHDGGGWNDDGEPGGAQPGGAEPDGAQPGRRPAFGDREPGEDRSAEREPGEPSVGDHEPGERKLYEQDQGERELGERDQGERELGERELGDREPGDQEPGEPVLGERELAENRAYENDAEEAPAFEPDFAAIEDRESRDRSYARPQAERADVETIYAEASFAEFDTVPDAPDFAAPAEPAAEHLDEHAAAPPPAHGAPNVEATAAPDATMFPGSEIERDPERPAPWPEMSPDTVPAATEPPYPDPSPAGDSDPQPETRSDFEPEAAASQALDFESTEPETIEPERPEAEALETVGGDEMDEGAQSRPHHHFYRQYKVQEVIKRRQILLVQVTKEERGNKGAALTTFLSLAGRYCVLMPNAGRGGGVSRKITSPTDRRRLKELMEELEVPDGMGVIVRTAGSERSKPEIHRDYDYLMRLWDDIRDLTLRSSAPALIYEEGTLIKRAIRDLYSNSIDEILIEGRAGYEAARAFMQMLMPSHVDRVKLYNDPTVPLFHRYQVDSQIDQIHNPTVQLKSGGYIVINPTEALVAIDVNSGRSTRERNIEETATKTNLEAAEEIARQLRLRDLAGLIVIDFIDMEEGRNQAAVERRLKDEMRDDRARIQLGRISPFGLLELSRQRLRPSLIEASTQLCPHCNGTGTVRSTESAALVVLRAIEEEGIRQRTAEIGITVPTEVAVYMLNHKRDALTLSERRYGFKVLVAQDPTLVPPAYRLERIRAFAPGEYVAAAELEEAETLTDYRADAAPPAPAIAPARPTIDAGEAEASPTAAPGAAPGTGPAQAAGGPRKKRRRRRRRGGEERFAQDGTSLGIAETESETGETEGEAEFDEAGEIEGEAGEGFDPDGDQPDIPDSFGNFAAARQIPGEAAPAVEDSEARRRRRGRRGGRNRRDGAKPAYDAAPYDALGTPPPEDFARDGREALFEPFGEDEIEPVAPIPAAVPEVPAAMPEDAPAAHEKPVEPALQPAPETVESAPAAVSEPRRRAPRRKKAEAESGAEPAAPKPRPRRARAAAALAPEPVEAEAEPEALPVVASEAAAGPEAAPEPPAQPPGEAMAADSAPVETIAETIDETRPKRAGWWRRMLE